MEDDEAIGRVWGILLEGEGYTVQEAEDGFRVSEKLSETDPDYTGCYDAWNLR